MGSPGFMKRKSVKRADIEKVQDVFDQLSTFLDGSKTRLLINVGEAWTDRLLNELEGHESDNS